MKKKEIQGVKRCIRELNCDDGEVSAEMLSELGFKVGAVTRLGTGGARRIEAISDDGRTFTLSDGETVVGGDLMDYVVLESCKKVQAPVLPGSCRLPGFRDFTKLIGLTQNQNSEL